MDESNKTYIDVIVGSSPLMLIHAQWLAVRGRSVCVIDEDSKWGGAWKSHTLDNGESVEVACHLIESYPGIYSLLAQASGIDFVPTRPAPVRVGLRLFRFPYVSRFIWFLSASYLCAGECWFSFAALLNFDRAKSNRLNFRRKREDFFKYQVSNLKNGVIIQGPLFGYTAFVQGLVEQAEKKGVVFIQGRVTKAKKQHESWVIDLEKSDQIQSTALHLSSSVTLKADENKTFVQSTQQLNTRSSVVVSITSAREIQGASYVGFWRHPTVTRISRIDKPAADSSVCVFTQLYLIEFQRPPLVDDCQTQCVEALITAGVCTKADDVQVIHQFSYCYPEVIHELNTCTTGDLVVLSSSGNLAAGVARWLSDRARFIKLFPDTSLGQT